MSNLRKYFNERGQDTELLEALIRNESKERLEELADRALKEDKVLVAEEHPKDLDRIVVKLV